MRVVGIVRPPVAFTDLPCVWDIFNFLVTCVVVVIIEDLSQGSIEHFSIVP